MSFEFGKLIKAKRLKFAVTPHAVFSSDLHAKNFLGYFFNTTPKNINERTRINAYYRPGEEILLQGEAVERKFNVQILDEIQRSGFDRVENITVYHNILELCMLEGIDTKEEIFKTFKEFADFCIGALELNAIICGYHFNQDEPHLHIIYTKAQADEAKNNDSVSSNEDEDL